MKKLFLFLLLSSTAFSQPKTVREKSIESNLDWIKRFEENVTMKEKLNLIIEKVKQDSIISYNPIITYISNGHIHDSIDSSKNCKILFVLNQKRNMWLIDLNQFPKYSKILKFITAEKIEKINVINQNAGIAVFGQRGGCGVIMINSHSGKLKRLFKKASKSKSKNVV
ncbi:hypothetical protein [Flavobacterium terrisoli]|uniref:hypothetical protein n=1 Tax=Flavobacterium terrisoli TaxID=3242195 RepID=UPI0025437D27|nr:hypothetical protein [Flavobacterium buctense]